MKLYIVLWHVTIFNNLAGLGKSDANSSHDRIGQIYNSVLVLIQWEVVNKVVLCVTRPGDQQHSAKETDPGDADSPVCPQCSRIPPCHGGSGAPQGLAALLMSLLKPEI